VFDSDVMIKPEVHAALRRLKALLESRGARVMADSPIAAKAASRLGLMTFLAAGHSVAELFCAGKVGFPHPASARVASAEDPRASDGMNIES